MPQPHYTTYLTPEASKILGVRAYTYVESHGLATSSGRSLRVADRESTPAGIARTLTRVCGRAETLDRGEYAYWTLPASCVRTDPV